MAEQSPDQRPSSAPLEPSRDVVMGKTGTTPVVLPDDPFDESLDDPFEEEEDELADEVANEQPTASPEGKPDRSIGAPASRRSNGAPSRREPGARPNRHAADRSEGPSRETRKPKKRRHPIRVVVVTLLVLALVLAGAAAGGFAWLRWFSADDAADFQGTWYLAGTSTPITITEDRIRLTDDVSYHYTIDPETKTFELTFGNLVGGGRYRFSLDRQELALVDGRYNGNDILSDDFSWTARALVAEVQGNDLAPEVQATKGVTLLSRTPAKTIAGLASNNAAAAASSSPIGGLGDVDSSGEADDAGDASDIPDAPDTDDASDAAGSDAADDTGDAGGSDAADDTDDAGGSDAADEQ